MWWLHVLHNLRKTKLSKEIDDTCQLVWILTKVDNFWLWQNGQTKSKERERERERERKTLSEKELKWNGSYFLWFNSLCPWQAAQPRIRLVNVESTRVMVRYLRPKGWNLLSIYWYQTDNVFGLVWNSNQSINNYIFIFGHF